MVLYGFCMSYVLGVPVLTSIYDEILLVPQGFEITVFVEATGKQTARKAGL